MAVAPVRVQAIEEAIPFGDLVLAPAAATGRSEAELARAITGLAQSTLPARIAGVSALMRRTAHPRPDAGARKRAA